MATLVFVASCLAQPCVPAYQRDGEILFALDTIHAVDPDSGGQSTCNAPLLAGEYGECGQAHQAFQYASSMELSGYNKRTVGNGLVGQVVDAEGRLLHAETLIQNGLLAAEARLRMLIYSSPTGPGRGYVTSYVERVNDCVIHRPIQVYYGSNATHQRVEIPIAASCLRYGVRTNDQSLEPTAARNEIVIVTPTPPAPGPSPVCQECGDRNTVQLRRPPWDGDVRWLREAVPGFALTMDNWGEQDARMDTFIDGKAWAALIEFEALAPIALVHGYTSSVEFWNTYDDSGANPETESDRFVAPLDERRVGYGLIGTKNASGQPSTNRWNKKPNISPGPTERVAEALQPELRALADRFGADYVNIVSHSMGAIWSRAVIERLKAAKLSENPPGVLYFVSMSPMHHGSVLADLREVYAWKNIPKFFLFGDTGQGGFPFWKRMLTRIFGRADASLLFATTWKSADFNERQELPEEFRVKGVKTELSKWTLANSFNENENCDAGNFDQVECGDNPGDPDECKRQRSRLLGLDLSRGVNQARSSTLQRLQRVEISQTPSGEYSAEFITQPFPAEPPTANCPHGRYPLNDFTLRTENMFFRHFKALPGPGGRSYRFANHSMVGHRSVAEELLVFPLRAGEQRTLKENQ